jgi:diacylglycerol kinase (ATP)
VLQHLKGAPGLAHALTQGPGDETRLATQAVERGFRRIVAVGGDGTWSNVANGILRSGVRARLGLVPGGTGCDLAKTLGIPPRDVAACCRIVLDGHSRAIDAGRVEDRYFLNIAGFGYDVAVLEDSWSVQYLEGSALYLYCALRQLHSFSGFEATSEAEGEAFGPRDLLMLIVANARVFGGGFRIAPGADPADGKLEAVAFANMGFAARVGVMLRLLRGTHLAHARVSSVSTRRLVCRFAAPPRYETDGEWNQARAAELVIESVPGALDVLVPAP